MEENPNKVEPESPIKITVTDDDTGQEVISGSESEDDTEPQKEPEKTDAESQNGTSGAVEETPGAVEGTSGAVDGTPGAVDRTPETLSTNNLVALRRESVALQEMDKQNDWLSEIDKKSANLETAFISKIQYVALSNHYKKFIDVLQEKKTVDPGKFCCFDYMKYKPPVNNVCEVILFIRHNYYDKCRI